MGQLPEFRLEAYLSQWEYKARFHLAASDVETMSMSSLLDLADDDDRCAWETLRLGYTETAGDPGLRQAIAASYDHAGPDDIVCFAGAEEGLYLAMRVLLNAGDHAIVVTPNYQSAETIPLSLCSVTGVALDESHDWALDIDQVVDAVQPNTRMISVNFPNNPTGKIVEIDVFVQLARLCDERGIHLFSDEVYHGLERDTSLRLPQAVDLSERALSLNVVSKSLGLPGLRMGWIACRDPSVRKRLENAKLYTSLCNSAPSEVLARIALKAKELIVGRNRALIQSNTPHFDAFFADFDDLFEWQPPDGGSVAFPRYLGTGGVETFCEELVHDTGVLLLPASMYRSELTPTPRDRFRVGVGRANPAEGLETFARWLRSR